MFNKVKNLVIAIVSLCSSFNAHGHFEDMQLADPDIKLVPGNLNNFSFHRWVAKKDLETRIDLLDFANKYENMPLTEKETAIEELLESFPELEEIILASSPDPTQISH